jgi:LysR family transcriptional regulator, hydrogen peroxide-inducible genes activator
MVIGAHDLTLRQLQYVVAVADALGFHKAAARCHVSQPALSGQVQQLEAALGVRLFERDRRRVLVTSAGAEIIARARRVLVEVDDLVASASLLREPFAGTLRVGVLPTIAPYLLPEVMPRVAAKYPKLALVLREEKTADIARELGEGTLDAGLLALEAEVGNFEHAEIGKDEFLAALPKAHPLARKKRLSLSDLQEQDVLLLDEGHCFRDQALAICSKAHAKETTFRATSLATLAQMVSSGAGITLLPAIAVTVENRRGQLAVRPFAKPTPGRTLAFVWRHQSPKAAVLRELAKTFRSEARATGKT